MKLSKTMKKLVAYVCAIAMVVASLTGYQARTVGAVEVQEGYTLLPSDWTTGGSTGAWDLYAGDWRETGWQYAYVGLKNDETDPYKISLDFIETTGGDWLVQADVTFSGLTVGTEYKYVIKNGDDILATKIFEATADTEKTDMLNLGGTAQGTVMNLVATCEEYSSGTTIEYGKNIVEDAKWLGWFEAENWANYDISSVGTGYTLTDKNIGPNWYSIQTGIDNVEFLATKYACEFTLTAASPKKFKVDNRTDDSTIFTEEEGGQWVSNEDGTYSYKYKGTFESTKSQFLNVRVSLGYFAEDENYAANDVASFTVSDFTIYAVSPEDTSTSEVTEPAAFAVQVTNELNAVTIDEVVKYQVSLSWDAVDGVDYYYVYRDGTEAAVAPDGYPFGGNWGTRTAVEVWVPAGTHTYEVAAFNADGEEIDRTAAISVTNDQEEVTGETATDESVSDEPASDEPATDAPSYNPGFDPATLTYQEMTCEGGETIGFALQSSTIDGVVPFYENSGNTFSVMFSGDAGIVTDVVINGQEPDEGVVIEKATGVVRVNPTSFADNAYTVVEVTAENGELTFVVKKGTPASVPVKPDPTEPDVTEPDVTEPDVTEPDVTEPVEMTFEQIAGTGEDITRGNYGLWINQSNVMEIAVDPTDANHIQGRIVSNNNNWDQWGAVQYKVQKTGLNPGEEYTISVDLNASGNDGVIVTDGDVASVDFSQTTSATLTRTVTADENGAIVLTIGAGQVGIGVILDFSNVIIKDSQGNIVDTDIPTPTDPETTTPGVVETTTEDTVVNPTTKEPATAAPTTTTPSTKVTAPAKAKIKKITAKKRSAKKVKLTIKKVAGAAGYQVAIYKTKKNAKKNKKAVVKKVVTKRKVTIKSKKLKNKKKLFIRVRAYKLDADGTKVYGKWSKRKKVKIK